MKKMKRFLSLLLCMVMLMSILPMSTVAAGPGPGGPEGPGGPGGPDGPAAGGAGYTVTFVPDNGTDIFSLVTKPDGKLEPKDTPKDISKKGYTFDGWYVVADVNGSIAEDAAKVDLGKAFDKDTCLKAKWIPNEYRVKFDGNGATKGKMDPQKFTYDQMQRLTPNAFEKEGYTFTGWNTKKDGSGDSYGDGEEVENLAEQGEVKLFAQWKKADDPAPPADPNPNPEPTEFEVTFDSKGGTAVAKQTVAKDGTATKPADPAKTEGDHNFRFLGWYTKADELYDFSSPVTAKVELEAKWIKLHDVTFYAADGETVLTVLTVDEGTTVSADDVAATGYEGSDTWYKMKKNGTPDKVFNFEDPIKGCTDLIGDWTLIEYTITYNLDGGTVATENPATYTVETPDFTLNNPSKDGCTFAGWTGTELGGATPEVKIVKGSTGNRAYTATWTKNVITYTVSYDANGGTGAPEAQTKTEGVNLTLSSTEPTRSGYTFTGWNTKADGTGTGYEAGATYATDADLELYAQWKAHTYKVRFIRGGGTGSMADQEFTYGVEQELRENTFTREDYEFSHWVDDAETKYEDKAVVQNLTAEDNGIVELVAVWKNKQNVSNIELDITFVPDNGSEVFTRTTGFDGKLNAADIPDDPVKEGYTFGGWYVVEGAGYPVPEEPGIDPVTLTDKFERAVCLKAKWTANTYTVKFEGNGETDGNMDDQTFKSGEEQALTANAFEKTGYTFTGWNTAANGGGTAYEDNQLLSGLTENLTLYAQWSPTSYTISYFDEDGSTPLTTTNPTAYTVESDNITLVNPTRDGYTFAGWTGTDLTGPAMEVIIAQGSTGNRAYTATWTKNVITCTVSFNGNGGTGTMDSIVVNKGADYRLPDNGFTAPAGKTFKCWTIGRARANYQPGDTIKIEGDTVITANWESTTTDSDLDYVPAAGDNFPIFLWAGLLLFSVVALVEVVVLRRKRN